LQVEEVAGCEFVETFVNEGATMAITGDEGR
jgi:hypothetical protein